MSPPRRRSRLSVEALEARLTPTSFGNLSNFQVLPEVPLLSRLARFVPGAVPSVSNWVSVSAADQQLDPAGNGGASHLYVIAHGWAPGFQTMVADNGTATDPLKWWQTLDTSLPGSPGAPASSEMFYGDSGDGVQISPTGLAYALTQADPKAIVLAYSWIDDSATADYFGSIPADAYQSEAYTALNGTRLADALEQALPATFHADGGLLHLIGHSHGSKVATVAAVALTQTGNPNFGIAHLTVLDSPEDDSYLVSEGDAANNLWYFLGALNIGRSAGQTFVDNYISEFDSPFGPIQGVNPLTGTTTTALQQIVDVNLNGGVLFHSVDLGSLHGYSFSWYGGGSLAWAQNLVPVVADQWSPLVNPSTPATLAGSYTQSWTEATQPQFALAAGPQTNTATETPAFTSLAPSDTSVTAGSTFDSPSGTLTLIEDGSSTATFNGSFSPEDNLAGISFNYQFSNVGQGDQLVFSIDNGPIYYVMTGTVAGTGQGVGTLSLSSYAGAWFDHTIQAQLSPAAGSSGASVTITNMQQFTSGLPSLTATKRRPAFLATGAPPGSPPVVTVIDSATGATLFQVTPFDPAFTGGVRTALVDVNGDGVPDVVAAAGPGGGPDVKIFDGRDGSLLREFFAFDPQFTGGVNLAAGSVGGDTLLVAAAGPGGGPDVKVFNADGSLRYSFFAYDPQFTGGVRVAVGDVTGDGRPDIVTGAGPGGGPDVRIFDGASGRLVREFFAFDPAFTGGISVAAGDVTRDGRADILVGAGPGGGPSVGVFSGRDGSLLREYFAYDPTFLGGVRVAAADLDADGFADIVTSMGTGAAASVHAVSGKTGASLDQFFANDPLFGRTLFEGGY